MSYEKETGKTKDAGYQFGKRKTFPLSAEEAWERLFSEGGMQHWLGKGEHGSLEVDRVYETKDGITGKVRLIKPYSHIRMSWKKEEWDNESTLQIRVIAGGNDKSTISFHQEKLLDPQQRTEMKSFWEEKFEELNKYLTTQQKH